MNVTAKEGGVDLKRKTLHFFSAFSMLKEEKKLFHRSIEDLWRLKNGNLNDDDGLGRFRLYRF